MKIKTDNGEEIAIEFAEGFFDSFEGTPEEMQEMLDAVFGKIKDGTFFDDAEPFDMEELDEDEADEIMDRLDNLKPKHTLQ
jgi:hypothetical protein